MDRSEPSSSGMNGGEPKKKRKYEEEKPSSSQRSKNWRQQQKEQDPEGFRERERLRTRERRQNKKRNQAGNQTICTINMSSKETQTDLTVSIDEVLMIVTPPSDSVRYKPVNQMDGTRNIALNIEQKDIDRTLPATASSQHQTDNQHFDLMAMSPISVSSDMKNVAPDNFSDILGSPGLSVEEITSEINSNSNDIDSIVSKIPFVPDTRTSTDACPEDFKRGNKQAMLRFNGSNDCQSTLTTKYYNQLPSRPSDKTVRNSRQLEEKISPPASVLSLVLDMEQEQDLQICSETNMPSSHKTLVTSYTDTIERRGVDTQLNEGSKSDTDTFSEFQVSVETSGSSNEYYSPASNPDEKYAFPKPLNDKENASPSQADSIYTRKPIKPRLEDTAADRNKNAERGYLDKKKDKEPKVPYKKKGEFYFYGKKEKEQSDIRNMLVLQDKVFIWMYGMEYIEEVSERGKVGSLTTVSKSGKKNFVKGVAISLRNGAIWFCCADNSVNKYLDETCTEIFRTRYVPCYIYIDSSNVKDEVYVCHEMGLEIWDEDGSFKKCIHLYRDSTDSNGNKVLYEPKSVNKDTVSGRVLVTTFTCAPILIDKEVEFISMPFDISARFWIYSGCFNHKGNILLGTDSGVYVLSELTLETLTILRPDNLYDSLLCLPNHDLWISALNCVTEYSYTDE